MEHLADERCIDWRLGDALTSYCFGGLSDDERQAVEKHLIDCEACWTEFQRLDASVRTLRFNQMLHPALPVTEVVSMLGLSSRLNRPFGGHRRYVLWIAGLYGLEWMLSVWTELGYSYDRFGSLAWVLSGPTLLWMTAALVLALFDGTKSTVARETNGLMRSLTIMLSMMAVIIMCMMFVLPAEQTIAASFQTRTASGGYFKNAIVHFLPLLVFVIPTFHAVLRLQTELRSGRHRMVLGLLTREPSSVRPRRMIYLSPQLLSGVLLVLGVIKILGMNYMLDALTPGPYANLFSIASYVSTAAWFAIALISLAWYSTSLNELKREAKALDLLDRRDELSGEH